MKKVKDIVKYIEGFAPQNLAEEWDSVGLMVGSMQREVKRVMVCLDVTSNVVENAVKQRCEMIVSHHPFLFKPLKRLTEETKKDRSIMDLIRNHISVYSAHTNLDISDEGTNSTLAETLGLTDISGLKTVKTDELYKITVFVPKDHLDNVREAMSKAGAGCIGNYSDCSFSTEGTGTFRPLDKASPFIGAKGKLEFVDEAKLETIATKERLADVISAMWEAHPYEEVAYDIFREEIPGKQHHLGKIGILTNEMTLEELVEKVKKALKAPSVRIVGKNPQTKIKRVAVFTGSFDGDIKNLEKTGVDVLITGDVKYHTAMEIEEAGLCVIDAGHFYTEMLVADKVANLIKTEFGDLEVVTSKGIEYDPFRTM